MGNVFPNRNDPEVRIEFLYQIIIPKDPTEGTRGCSELAHHINKKDICLLKYVTGCHTFYLLYGKTIDYMSMINEHTQNQKTIILIKIRYNHLLSNIILFIICYNNNDMENQEPCSKKIRKNQKTTILIQNRKTVIMLYLYR